MRPRAPWPTLLYQIFINNNELTFMPIFFLLLYLAEVQQQQHASAAAAKAAREQRARMFPDCDSTSDGDFVDVRCREDDSGPRYPRNETTTDAEGRASSRCACYGDLGVSDARRAYPGCDLTSTRCRAPLGAGVG